MRSKDLTVIHAHSISTLPVGVVLKWLTGAPVIYDAHELESEIVGVSPLQQKLSRWIEKLCIRGVDRTVTVSDSIAGWYADTYSMERPIVIRNVPMRSAAPTEGSAVLRDNHGIPNDAFLYLYQGGLSTGRGVEALIEVFAGLDLQRHLVFMGYGVLEDHARQAASRYPNIHFQTAVPPDRVLYYTASADIGLCLIENTCLSYYYSLPNKLFEYLLSGLPVMVNDMPEQRSIVERFGCGWIVPPSIDQLKALIESINTEELEARKAGVAQAAKTLDWEHEAVSLRELYVAVAGDKAA
jgi:glycosyltransferase involved in cell wall biosynthesis